MRIAFAWWGTWWHVFPVQSLIKYITKIQLHKHEFFWFGEKPSLEYDICSTLTKSIPHVVFVPITSGKWRREKWIIPIFKNIVWLFAVWHGTLQSLIYLLYHKIDTVFCKWWYVSLPVVFAAYILRKPVYLHESDTSSWLANRICSEFATTIFTWFAWVFPWKEIVVWQILDDDIVPLYTSDNTQWWSQQTTHILITWWSQGAQSLYEPLIKILHDHKRDNTHFHIVLWTKNQSLASPFSDLSCVTCYDFVSQSQMGKLLLQCDVAITRWWTTSLAEQHLFALKKIIVPIPRTHDQLKNAQYYCAHYDDILVRQDVPWYEETLWNTLINLSTYKKHLIYTWIGDHISYAKNEIVTRMLLK